MSTIACRGCGRPLLPDGLAGQCPDCFLRRARRRARAGLVLGLLALGVGGLTTLATPPASLLGFLVTALTAPAGLACSALSLRALRHHNPDPSPGRGIALAGVGAGSLGILLGTWLLLVAVEAVQDASDRAT